MIFSYLIGFIPVIIIFTLMPYLTRKDNFFGISAPESFYGEKRAKKMRKAYSVVTLLLGAVFVLVLLLGIRNFSAENQAYLSTALFFGMMLCWSILYIYMHNKAKNIKIELNWSEITKPSAVADTTFSTRKIAVSKMWFIAYAIIIILTVVAGLYFYADMPENVLIRMNADGSQEYAQKSFGILLIMPATQLLIALVFGFIYYSIKRARPELSADDAKASAQKNAKHRYAWSCFTVFGGMGMLLLFVLIQLEFLGILNNIAYIGSIIFTSALILATVVLSILYGQSGSRLKSSSDAKQSDSINREDDIYWKKGMFYVNRKDPSLFVEKRFGIGYTVNFARPGAWIFMAVILAVVAGSLLLGR